MFAQFFVVGDNGLPREFAVEGTTFSPFGAVTPVDGKGGREELSSDPIQRLAEIGSICNDSKIAYNLVSQNACFGDAYFSSSNRRRTRTRTLVNPPKPP